MTTTIKTAKTLHNEAIEKLSSDLFSDGTYDIDTCESVEFNKGYQVTFWNIGDDYSDERYDYLVSLFTELSMDGKTYLGKFDGSAEISWRFSNKKLAKKYAKLFNQISIWDWKHCEEIKTGGTGKR